MTNVINYVKMESKDDVAIPGMYILVYKVLDSENKSHIIHTLNYFDGNKWDVDLACLIARSEYPINRFMED